MSVSQPPAARKKPSGWVHWAIIAALYASAYPAAVSSWKELYGGDWIALDFRGAALFSHLALAGIAATVVLVHLAVKRYSRRLSVGLVLLCALVPALLVPLRSMANRQHIKSEDERRVRERDDQAHALSAEIGKRIRLRWRVDFDADPPQATVELLSEVDLTIKNVDIFGAARPDQLPQFFGSYKRGIAPFLLSAGQPQRFPLPLNRNPSAAAIWYVDILLERGKDQAQVVWADPHADVSPGALPLPPPDL
jgi:hypothetical protein